MIPLNQVQVPKPCGEEWDAMDGDAQQRFCAGCGCHVHDLSAMTTPQAQDILDKAEGRLCVRFQTRPDGTVLTQNEAPMPSRRVFWPRRLAVAASWVLALALTGLGVTVSAEPSPHKTNPAKPKPHTATSVPKHPRVFMGMIAMPRQTIGHPASVMPKPPTTIGNAVVLPVMGHRLP
jgi:hypothetical protein